MAPRGNAFIKEFHQIKNIRVYSDPWYEKNYVWHTDLFGHENKLPGVLTGFFMLESPLLGGETDFISGETVYEKMSENEKCAAGNVLTVINRAKFFAKQATTDYSGSLRTEPYFEWVQGNVELPILFAPEHPYEQPRIILLPSFFEKVAGWSVEESRQWMLKMMMEHALPHRFSIQWKKGDLCVFNNRRFMHSSTPTRNYLDFQRSSKRLLFQTFVPTTRPLYGIRKSAIQGDKLLSHTLNLTSNPESSIRGYDAYHDYSQARFVNQDRIWISTL